MLRGHTKRVREHNIAGAFTARNPINKYNFYCKREHVAQNKSIQQHIVKVHSSRKRKFKPETIERRENAKKDKTSNRQLNVEHALSLAEHDEYEDLGLTRLNIMKFTNIKPIADDNDDGGDDDFIASI